jgi:hypothetical protein
MSNIIDARKMLERAYIGLAEEALKKGDKRTDGDVICCKCGESNVTLIKIHKDGIYACVDCINKRGIEEAQKELKKQKK